MNNRSFNADVIIIGGGPAGSTLGCLVVNGGHRAIIVERTAHPREHVGELLTPSVNAVLHRIDLLSCVDAAGFVRREGVGWTMPLAPVGQVLTIPVAQHPPPRALRRYGFNVEREIFDALLLGHACRCGVQVLEGATAQRVVFEHGRAKGLEVRQPDGRKLLLTAPFVVDASGRSCLLGRQLNLLERSSGSRRCAIYAWFRDVAQDAAADETYALVHGLDQNSSWGWQIPLREGVSSIGCVGPCQDFQHAAKDPDTMFRHAIRRNRTLVHAMAPARQVRDWRIVGDYGYRVRQLFGRGWLLLGDASGFIDPIFSSGVDIAMYSAVFAYESILPLLLLGHWTDTDEQFALSSYENRLRRGTAIWAQGVELFYRVQSRLCRVAREQEAIPLICRFLQGNPYEVQNQMLFKQLLENFVQHERI